MAVTSHVFPHGIHAIATKAIDLSAASGAYAGLCTGDASAWGATQQAYQFVSDVKTAYTECANADYLAQGASGRITLVTLTVSDDSPAGKVVWTCTSPAPISWGAASTITARSMFIYTHQVGSADASYDLLTIIDFGLSVSSTAGAYTYTVDPTNGLAYFNSV